MDSRQRILDLFAQRGKEMTPDELELALGIDREFGQELLGDAYSDEKMLESVIAEQERLLAQGKRLM